MVMHTGCNDEGGQAPLVVRSAPLPIKETGLQMLIYSLVVSHQLPKTRVIRAVTSATSISSSPLTLATSR